MKNLELGQQVKIKSNAQQIPVVVSAYWVVKGHYRYEGLDESKIVHGFWSKDVVLDAQSCAR